jgi:hypothetical protein
MVGCSEVAGKAQEKEDELLWAVNRFGEILAEVRHDGTQLWSIQVLHHLF